MHYTQLAAAAGLLTLAAASPIEKRCFGPLVAITVRGTDPTQDSFNNDANPGDAILSNIATSAYPGIYVNPLSYPATGIIDPNMYGQSIIDGVANLGGLVDYILDNQCNGNTKIIMLGYSQGASVIATYIGGGNSGAPLATGSRELNAIAGGVIMAGPDFQGSYSPLADHSQFRGNGAILDGDNYSNLNNLKGSVFAALCENGDHWCANNPAADPNFTIHDNEESFWQSEAISYLQGLKLDG